MTDRKDVWYVPKRTSIIQIAGLVEAAIDKNLSGKTFRAGQQEALATALRMRGLTVSRNLSQQSVRTLLASGPQYLGLIYKQMVDGVTKLHVTPAGFRFAEEGNLKTNSQFSRLDDWESNHQFPNSEIVLNQLFKLILNNPVSNNGGHFSVFPFRMVVKLCLELGYLDSWELAYFVFQLRSQSEFETTVERIKNWRSLTETAREREIDVFKKTPAGKLTLVKAPSVSYFMNVCAYSGMFTVSSPDLAAGLNRKAIHLIDVETANAMLHKYSDDRIYDFQDNLSLWMEYYGDPDRLTPPHDYIVQVKTKSGGVKLIELSQNGATRASLTFDGQLSAWSIPMFKSEKYTFKIYDADSDAAHSVDVVPGDNQFIEIDEGPSDSPDIDLFESSSANILHAIEEVSASGWDSRMKQRISLIRRVTGRNHENNRTKGGRLEQLFALLLAIAVSEGRVDGVRWYGKIGLDGIAGPAPGGALGNPDIVFELDDLAVVLELTTIRGTRAQWNSSEAASVPDHINSYIHTDHESRIVGVFSAPSIDSRVRNNFELHERDTGTPISCVTLTELAQILMKDRAAIKAYLELQLTRVQ